ncbi:MAG: MATE family efflux transporter [Acidobacteriota bacterium]
MAAADSDLRRRFWRLTVLNVLTNVTVPTASLVDTAILGHLEDIRFLAGVALGAIVFEIVFWSFGFLRMATTGLTAQAVGRRDQVEMHRILQRSATLALIAGFALLALRAPIGDLAFGILSGDPGAEDAGRAYYDARVLGAPAALLNFVLLGWFLGREESRVALAMTVVANATNIALDYLFILRFDWAAYGAGLATTAAELAMLATGLAFYLRRREGVGWSLRALRERGPWRAMFGLQGHILVRTLFLVGTFAAFTDLSARLGTETLAANTLLLRILTFAAFFIDGIAFAVESLAGIFAGERASARLKRLIRLALAAALGCAAAFALVVTGAPGALFGLLTSHGDLVARAADLRWWLAATLLVGSAAYVYDGLFLGLTAGRRLRDAMVVSTALGFLPLALLALARRDVHLLWAALLLFMVARVVTLGLASRQLPGLGVGASDSSEQRPETESSR